MFLTKRNLGRSALLAIAAGALLVPVGPASADPVVQLCIVTAPPVRRERDYAGTLSIDGRLFRIDSRYSVRDQILDALDYMHYDAWCVDEGVRVRRTVDGPEIWWYNGERGMIFQERYSTITLTPTSCAPVDFGRCYRYRYDHGHGHYYCWTQVEVRGHIEWTSLGLCIQIGHDHDDHHHPRTDYRPRYRERHESRIRVDHRGRTNDSDIRPGRNYDRDRRDAERRDRIPDRIDDRSSRPDFDRDRNRRTDDTRDRTERPDRPSTTPAPRQPSRDDLKRSPQPERRIDQPKALPIERREDLKRTPPARQAEPAKQPSQKSNDTKPREQSKPSSPSPAQKKDDTKKSKW